MFLILIFGHLFSFFCCSCEILIWHSQTPSSQTIWEENHLKSIACSEYRRTVRPQLCYCTVLYCNNLNVHFTPLSSPLGGPSVSAVKRSVSRPLPPTAGSRLGRWRGQQSQLWHGHRSVCVCSNASSRPGAASHSHVTFVSLRPSYQGKPEDSSSRATWWLWWQAGFQGPVTPTSWGQSVSPKEQTYTTVTCWSAGVGVYGNATPQP